MCPLLDIFAQTLCWNFSTELLDFHKGFLFCGWLSKSVFPRASWTLAERSWSPFLGHFRVHSWDRGLYAYFLTHRLTRLLLGPWSVMLDHTAPTEGTFVCGWMPNCFCWGGAYSQMMSYLAMFLTSFSPRQHVFFNDLNPFKYSDIKIWSVLANVLCVFETNVYFAVWLTVI